MLKLVSKGTPDVSEQIEDQLSQKRFQLAKLLRSTEEILVCAQKGDWESVEEMEHSRKIEIADCFSNQSHEETPLIAEALATLIYLNEQITELVKQAKSDLMKEQRSFKSGRLAAQNYQNYQESLESL